MKLQELLDLYNDEEVFDESDLACSFEAVENNGEIIGIIKYVHLDDGSKYISQIFTDGMNDELEDLVNNIGFRNYDWD